ncbi:ttll-11_11 [Blepharisma stoltei]|uniref:Uncharacterized protein n=1 Tax=Blepharisma stoltei TaxID=1481888 RepID=A0AAU9JWB9_9CILI|nr:unnamed protein product [Blepharisma stoltei]
MEKEAKRSKIIFNVSNTKYEIIKHVGSNVFGWILSNSPTDSNWDLFWTDNSVIPDRLSRMKPHQKINHFPGMFGIARKNCMANNLNKMRNIFPHDYNFYPKSWVLPSDLNEFKAELQQSSKTYIVKPEASSQGRGIYLVKRLEDLRTHEHCIAQRYLQKPFLIDGLKFDLRIYVLLSACDPLRIFIHEEGLARFATEEYQNPSRGNLDEMFMHLTNYAVNKHNPKFVQNEDPEHCDIGHKRSLSSVLIRLEEEGYDVTTLWDRICDIIIKTICTIQPSLSHFYRSSQPDDVSNGMCFEILGFDIILDHKLRPYLLEVNHSPSFTTDSQLDFKIKERIISEALNIMNIKVKNRREYEMISKTLSSNRIINKKSRQESLEEKKGLRDEATRKNDRHSDKHCGGYIKIFPGENDDYYQQFLEAARELWSDVTAVKQKRQTETARSSTPTAIRPISV